MQCILKKVVLGSRAVRGDAYYWHHIGVVVVAGNTGAAVANRLLLLKWLQLTEVVDTRVDDDVAQFVLAALVTVTATVIVMNVVATVTTATVVDIVVDYGSG